jgi:predicted glycosyltransferase
MLFYVQHLLGVGHIKRASLLVQGCLQAGFEVTVVSGGEPVSQFGFAGAELVQLPPVKAADARFSGLVDQRDQPLTESFKQQRRAQLLATLERVRPQLLLIENYPFGRRQLRWELKPLLERAQRLESPPKVVCSIRDILQARSPERIDETLGLVEHYFDRVLVHGDPDFIPLELSFPLARQLQAKLSYSGYVCEPLPVEIASQQRPEVLVSAGGGAVGFALLHCCLEALLDDGWRSRLLQALEQQPDEQLCWRLLLGPNLPAAQKQQLQQLAERLADPRIRLILEPLRRDFVERLHSCRLSISQGGYNTLMDLLSAGCRCLLVPFEGGDQTETEQLLRSQRLHQLGYSGLLRETELSATGLVAEIERTMAADRSAVPSIDCRGAQRSAELLRQLVQGDG